MAEKPTTGDPVLDELVRQHFTEAIAVTRQILVDRRDELSSLKVIDQVSAIIATQLWPIFGALFVEGASKNIQGLIGPGEDERKD